MLYRLSYPGSENLDGLVRDLNPGPLRETRNICALFLVLGTPQSDSVFQSPLQVEALEGEANLSCKHSSVTTETIFWYRKFPHQSPHFVVSGYSGKTRSTIIKGDLYVSKDRKSSILSFTSVSLEDSAVYYCALSDTVPRPGSLLVQKSSLTSPI
uniref:Ig-like domain-containing protein n=1 Tax=Salvator merianae TaxID=96440 RepID=A0A8D0B6U3_SALMN